MFEGSSAAQPPSITLTMCMQQARSVGLTGRCICLHRNSVLQPVHLLPQTPHLSLSVHQPAGVWGGLRSTSKVTCASPSGGLALSWAACGSWEDEAADGRE